MFANLSSILNSNPSLIFHAFYAIPAFLLTCAVVAYRQAVK